MHHDAPSGTEMPEDGITGQRVAALGVGHHQAFAATNRQRPPVVLFLPGLTVVAHHLAGHQRRQPVAHADVFQQLVQAVLIVAVQLGADHRFRQMLKAALIARQGLVQQALSQFPGVFPPLLLEEVANVGAGLAGDDKVEPGRIGGGVGGGDDLHRLPGLQRRGQRRQLAVHPGRHATVAHLGVHGVGEVHRSGAGGELLDVAFGREHVGFVGEQVHFDVLDELHRVTGLLLHLQQPLHPGLCPGVGRRAGFLLGLVQPVGGDAVVGHRFHFLGADLDFQRNPGVGLQSGMQGLVAVGLGNGHVVLEPARDGNEIVVHRAEHPVAGVHAVDDDAEAKHVHDFRERFVLLLHLVVDAVKVLLAPQHPGLNAFLLQAVFDAGLDRRENFLAVAPGGAHRLADQPGPHRMDGMESQILVLHAHVVHAQAEGDGRVDLQGFGGDTASFVGVHHMQRAHVVQAVGEFHQDHADVPRHCQDHLAQILRLLFRFGLELDLGDFGDAVDQFRHLLAEFRRQLFLGDAGILDHIVQHGRHQRGVVHVHIGENVGHRQRMRDVWVPGPSILALVGGLGEIVGAHHRGDLLVRQVAAQTFFQVMDGGQGLSSRRQGESMYAKDASCIRADHRGMRYTVLA